MGSAPQSLLFPVRCPACGRPVREFSPCPWCGERAPASPRARGDLVRLVSGWALLATAAGTVAAAATNGNPVEPAVPAGIASSSAGLFSGFFLAISKPPSGRTPGESARKNLAAALIASFFALAFRACAVPHPISSIERFSWFFPALAAACFALRVPAENPNAPASGSTPRERALRRFAPDLAAALSLAPFAAVFAFAGPSLPALVGLALVLGVWFGRLSRPAAPTVLSSAAFSLLLPDPAFLAFGFLAAAAVPAARGKRIRKQLS